MKLKRKQHAYVETLEHRRLLTTIPLAPPVDLGLDMDLFVTRDHALTDLDLDGDLDILLFKYPPGDFGAQYVSWRLNTGEGQFGEEVREAPRSEIEMETLSRIFPADLDGDGDDDLLVQSTGAWSWRENQFREGLGFADPIALDVPFRRIVGDPHDFDGDGLLDFVTETGWAQSLGEGEFQLHPIDGMSNNRTSVIADLDGDGDMDLVTANRNQVTIAWNGGASELFDTTTSWHSTSNIQLLAMDDLDRDGHAGLIVATSSFGLGQLGELENLETDPTFRVLSTTLLLNSLRSVLFTMVDGGVTTSVYLDQGGRHGFYLPGLEWQPIDLGDLRHFSTGDINGDGSVDWLGTSSQNEIRWADGVAADAVPHVVSTGANPWADNLQALDFDGDGDVDLLFEVLDGLWWRENQGDGRFGSHESIVATGFHYQIEDVSGDNRPDVIYQRTPSNDTLVWRENRGNAGLGEEIPLPANVVRFVDVDADGVLDFYVSNPGESPSMRLNENGRAVGDPIAMPYFTDSYDFDQDGDLDLLHSTIRLVTWTENMGDFRYADPVIVATEESVFVDKTLTFDADQDGDLDLVVIKAQVRLGESTAEVYENDGAAFSRVAEFAAEALNYHEVSVVDLDADGDLDLVGGGTFNQYFVENLGDFRFAGKQVLPGADGLRSRVVADLDGDGFPDLAGIDNQSRHIVWFRNELESRPRILTAEDVDQLFEAVRTRTFSHEHDWNRDGQVDTRDIDYLFDNQLQASRADFDLDGTVSFRDFLTLSKAFGKQDARWSDGDADGDGTVGFSDFLLFAKAFGLT